MRKLITIFTVIFTLATLATLAGCDETTGTQTSTTTPDSAATTTPPDGEDIVSPNDAETGVISFELPEEWNIQGYTAYLYEKPEDSAAPNVELEVSTRIGTEEEAKQKVSDLATQQSEVNATFTETEIGGEKVYIEEENSDLYYGEPMWINNIEFEKDGRIYTLWMTDRIQYRESAIEMLISTIKYETAR